MAVKVEIKDNSRVVLQTMSGNVEAALTAMGVKAENLILWQMRQGYGKPIRKTGDLQRDVSFDVDVASGTNGVVRVGNTLYYAPFVHEGTSRTKGKGKPYIKDGLTGENHAKQLQKVAEEALKKGFE